MLTSSVKLMKQLPINLNGGYTCIYILMYTCIYFIPSLIFHQIDTSVPPNHKCSGPTWSLIRPLWWRVYMYTRIYFKPSSICRLIDSSVPPNHKCSRPTWSPITPFWCNRRDREDKTQMLFGLAQTTGIWLELVLESFNNKKIQHLNLNLGKLHWLSSN